MLHARRGRDVAVIQSVFDYEKAEKERKFMRAAVADLANLEKGHEVPLDFGIAPAKPMAYSMELNRTVVEA